PAPRSRRKARPRARAASGRPPWGGTDWGRRTSSSGSAESDRRSRKTPDSWAQPDRSSSRSPPIARAPKYRFGGPGGANDNAGGGSAQSKKPNRPQKGWCLKSQPGARRRSAARIANRATPATDRPKSDLPPGAGPGGTGAGRAAERRARGRDRAAPRASA